MRTFFNQHKSLLIILLLISFISVVISCNNLSSKKQNYILIQKDSIARWLENSESKSFDPIQRKEFLLKAYKKNDEQILDSIKNINLLKIAYRAYKLNDSIFLKS